MASKVDAIADPRVPLSRERVLEAAIGLADAGGIEALTMRKLAGALGVEAMTLYYYVANKDEILSAIVDMVVNEFELPAPDEDWKPAIRRTAISAFEVLQRHPWAASLMLHGTTVSTARLRYMDAILGSLRRGGFSADLTDHAYHALDSHIMGFTLWVVSMNLGTEEDLAAMAEQFLRELPVDDLPHLAEHIQQHMKPRDPSDEGDFAFGLDLILDGLERIRETA
jgi:AcrR family transcriptional regulator